MQEANKGGLAAFVGDAVVAAEGFVFVVGKEVALSLHFDEMVLTRIQLAGKGVSTWAISARMSAMVDCSWGTPWPLRAEVRMNL